MRALSVSVSLPVVALLAAVGCASPTDSESVDGTDDAISVHAHAAAIAKCTSDERAVVKDGLDASAEPAMKAAHEKSLACVTAANDKTIAQIEKALGTNGSALKGKAKAAFAEFRADSKAQCELVSVGAINDELGARLLLGCERQREVALGQLIDAYADLGGSLQDLPSRPDDKCYAPFYANDDDSAADRALAKCSDQRYIALADTLAHSRVANDRGGVNFDRALTIATTSLTTSALTTKRTCELLGAAGPGDTAAEPQSITCRADFAILWETATRAPVPTFTVGRTANQGTL